MHQWVHKTPFSTLLLFKACTRIWPYSEKGVRSKFNIAFLKLWVGPGGLKYYSEKKLPQLLDRWYDHSKMRRWGNFFLPKKCLNSTHSLRTLKGKGKVILSYHFRIGKKRVAWNRFHELSISDVHWSSNFLCFVAYFFLQHISRNGFSGGQYWSSTNQSNISLACFLTSPGPTQTFRDAIMNFDLTPSSGYGHMCD